MAVFRNKNTEITPLLKDIKGSSSGTPEYSTDDPSPSSEDYDDDRDYKSKAGSIPLSRPDTEFRWKLSIFCILVLEMCERLTFYGITSNLVVFATNVLGYGSVTAVAINLSFVGVSFLLPVFGGWLADSFLGWYFTILGGSVVYLLGTILLPITSWGYNVHSDRLPDGELEDHPFLTEDGMRGLTLVSLLCVAVGTGGIKANVSPFGAHQVEHKGPEKLRSFFNWFYWLITLGSGLAVTFVAYIEQEVSFAIGYLVCAGSMLVALVLFLLPTRYYRFRGTSGNVIAKVYRIIWTGYHRKSLSTVRLPSTLDYASASYGGPFLNADVEGVKMLGRVFPVYLAFMVFGCIYGQSMSTFVLQAERMNLQLGSFMIPVASMSIFSVTTVLFLVPLTDKCLYPLLKNTKFHLTIMRRIGLGMFFAILTMCLAGILETCRRSELEQSGGFIQNVAGVDYNASHISVLAQIPQYFILGTSETFAAISGLELAYTQFPLAFKSIAMGGALLTLGTGLLLGAGFVKLINVSTSPNWFPDEINNGHIEFYFFFLGGVMAVALILFVIYTHFFFHYADYTSLSGLSQTVIVRSSRASSTVEYKDTENDRSGTETSNLELHHHELHSSSSD